MTPVRAPGPSGAVSSGFCSNDAPFAGRNLLKALSTRDLSTVPMSPQVYIEVASC